MKNLLRIGEFARMCRLTVKTVRFYGEAGILTPAFVAEDSGYRYYSPAQVLEVETIRLLRSLDVPVADIRSVLGKGDAALVELLSKQRGHLETELKKTEEVLASLNRLLTEKENAMSYQVLTKEVAPQPILYYPAETSLRDIGGVIHTAIGALFAYLGQVGATPAGPPGTLYLDDEVDKVEQLSIRVYVPTSRPISGNKELTGTELSGGTLAYTHHAGPFQEVGPAYGAVLQWMAKENYVASGPARETYLAKGDTPQENRAEVAFPVARRSR